MNLLYSVLIADWIAFLINNPSSFFKDDLTFIFGELGSKILKYTALFLTVCNSFDEVFSYTFNIHVLGILYV